MKRRLQLKRLLGVCMMLVCAIQLQAQVKTISGTVTSADDGTPLPGISVTVQGASTGTATDAQGKYTLSIPSERAKIVFSGIGFTNQTVSVNNRSVISVPLAKDTKQLSDIVVTALGISKQKKTVGFATQELAKKDLSLFLLAKRFSI